MAVLANLESFVENKKEDSDHFLRDPRITEMEAETIRERTHAGLQAARARGRKGGRPPMDKNKIDMALTLYDSKKYTIKEITERTGVSKAKIYQTLKNRTNHHIKV
ncbi:helix-turn-helix domain-containing protein [Paenibacillus alginolyticus]|uniref:helix-turn-helix domain-containing protein n=1 Tax=Paenibacillus alginolyticus TaxID=59839 RepID=UPI000685656C|nr:recombinase family protein [Paenibacillus alginolyticus]